jgi:hypothetical protein
MVITIQAEGRPILFRLDWKHSRWHSMEELDEALFPLIKEIDGRRYELYSDGTLAEVEK